MSKELVEATASHDIRVIEVRGERVVLDYEVARLFGTETKKLNQQVSRNIDKFGEDFSFRLTSEEVALLRSQNVTSRPEWGGTRHPPRAFTDHGVVMAATIVKSPQAIRATRLVVRTFVAVRRDAWERENLRASGGQLALSLDKPARQGLATKLNIALGHVLDAIIDPTEARSVRDEAREIAAQGLTALKDYLKKVGISNEKTLAEVRRMMAEAESIEVETARKRTENQHRQFALLAKQLRLIIQAQNYAESGQIEPLMIVLSELEKG
jgi:hypothetical protein